MSKETKNKIVPKLRFPEFKGDGNWESTLLGHLIEIKGRIGYRGYTVDDIVNAGEGAIALSPSNIDETGIISFEKSTYITWNKYEESPEIMLELGYTVLVKTGSTFGKTAFIKKLPEKATINPQLVVLKPTQVNAIFLFLLVSHSIIQKQIKETVVGGAIPTLSQDSISKFEVLIPKPEEQQKIAACLSSLDDLITTENQKLDALEEHKKGLMQQLFPAKGERVPKLRFEEFKDSGEWENYPLLKFIDSLDAGVSVNSGDRPAIDKELGILKTSCVTNGFFEPSENKIVIDSLELERLKEPVKRNTIIISRMNTPALVGANAYIEIDMANLYLPDRLWAAKPKSDANMRFIAYILGSAKGRKVLSELATGTSDSMKNISKADVLNIEILAPEVKEQKRIADLLSSLDKLITAQSEKIESLKKHKKGLMQQLFPAINDANK